MASQDIFFSVLKEKFPNLLMKIVKKKYVLLVPMKKFITPTMLNQNFYDNHVFYVSPYESNIYINLNGKSLIVKDSVFKAHLFWKCKDMVFKVKEKIIFDLGQPYGSMEYMLIDNVCDDAHYNSTISATSTDTKATLNTVKALPTSEEYVKYYTSFSQNNPDYREAERKLVHFVNLMKNNYIFVKDQEPYYYAKFIELINPIFEAFRNALAKAKADDLILMTVVPELIESLLFTKYQMYDTIMGNLIMFSAEEEKYLCEKLKESKNEYNLAFILGPQYKDCTLASAVEKMKELSTFKTHFEKFKLLLEINDIITNEANATFKKVSNNSNPSIDTDSYLSYWTFLLSQCNWSNFIAEINFVYHFNIFSNNFGGTGYFGTMIYSALGKIRRDIYKNEPPRFSLTQNIAQSTIITQAINPLKVTEYS